MKILATLIYWTGILFTLSAIAAPVVVVVNDYVSDGSVIRYIGTVIAGVVVAIGTLQLWWWAKDRRRED